MKGSSNAGWVKGKSNTSTVRVFDLLPLSTDENLILYAIHDICGDEDQSLPGTVPTNLVDE